MPFPLLNKQLESAHFEALFRYATMGMLVTDNNGLITAVNPFALNEFGYTEEELLGKRIEILIPPRFHQRHVKHHARYFKHPETRRMGRGVELIGIKKNGTEFPVEISLSYYEQEDAAYVITFVNDISERKNAELAIKKLNAALETTVQLRTADLQNALTALEISNHKLEAALTFQKELLHNAGVMIISTDENGIIESFNPEAEKNLGYTAQEVIGKYNPELFHCPEQTKKKAKELSAELGKPVEPGVETFIALARQNGVYADEWTYMHKDGHRFPVSLVFRALRNPAGIITGFIGVAVDISQRKKSEQEIRSVKNLLSDIVDNYPAGSISVVDKNFNYIFAGGQTVKALGLKPAEMIGKRLYPLMTEKQWKVTRKHLKKVFEGEKITDTELPDFIPGLRFTIDAFPLKEHNGAIDRIVVISRNISELKKTQEELEVSLRKEKELNELKSRFVSIASHEFRTPLSTVLSSAYLIEKYTTAEDQPKREKHLQHITSSVEMLTSILNDFLSVGKIEEGRINIRPAVFDLEVFMTAVIEELKGLLKDEQVIRYNHEGEHDVLLDQVLLKHITMNLVSNASKFSLENGLIEIKTSSRNNLIILSVKDHGIGISADDQKHLTERFFRGANASGIQGTGLGLHIVAKYAELMNGKLECRSELGKGTVFTITFTTKNRVL